VKNIDPGASLGNNPPEMNKNDTVREGSFDFLMIFKVAIISVNSLYFSDDSEWVDVRHFKKKKWCSYFFLSLSKSKLVKNFRDPNHAEPLLDEVETEKPSLTEEQKVIFDSFFSKILKWIELKFFNF